MEVKDAWGGWKLTVSEVVGLFYVDPEGRLVGGGPAARERHATLAAENRRLEADMAERLEALRGVALERDRLAKENAELKDGPTWRERAQEQERRAEQLAEAYAVAVREISRLKERSREQCEGMREELRVLKVALRGACGAMLLTAGPELPVYPLFLDDPEERVELSEEGKVAAQALKARGRRLVTLVAPDDRDLREVVVWRGSRQEEIYRTAGYREFLADPKELDRLLSCLDEPESVEEHLAEGNIEKAAELIWEALRPNYPPGQPEYAESGAEDLAEQLMAKAGWTKGRPEPSPSDDPSGKWQQAAEGWRKRAEEAETDLAQLREQNEKLAQELAETSGNYKRADEEVDRQAAENERLHSWLRAIEGGRLGRADAEELRQMAFRARTYNLPAPELV